MNKSRKFVSILLAVFFIVVAMPRITVQAQEFETTAKAYALIEANTRQIIASENGDGKFHAAGLTKLMSYLLFFEALADGKVRAEDSVRVSQEAAKKGGTSVFLDSGTSYSFETLLKPAIMCNANDAVTALAEHVAGSEAAFVELMNARAKELGLSSTFADCTGISSESLVSANDLAVIAAELSKYSGFFKYSAIWLDTFTHESGRETEMSNSNVLIKNELCDGMSTGSTPSSGYSAAISAKSGGGRFIAIVIGDKDTGSRFKLAEELIGYAIATFGVKQIAQQGGKVKTLPVANGDVKEVGVYAKEDLSILYKKGEEGSISTNIQVDDLVAPLQKGQVVGKIVITAPEGEISVALAVDQDVKEQSFGSGWHRLIRGFLGLVEEAEPKIVAP